MVIAAMMRIMATTIKSSIKEKPFWVFIIVLTERIWSLLEGCTSLATANRQSEAIVQGRSSRSAANKGLMLTYYKHLTYL